MQHIVWIDLETTGLYGETEFSTYGERDHSILEVGMIITDLVGNIKHMSTYVVDHDENEVRDKMNDYVVDMHTKNGLLTDIRLGTNHSLYNVESNMVTVINEVCKDDESKPYLGGSSSHFDRFFIATQMRRLNQTLHYRNYDVSTLIMFYKILTGNTLKTTDGESNHRALDDISHSLNVHSTMIKELKRKNVVEKYLNDLLTP